MINNVLFCQSAVMHFIYYVLREYCMNVLAKHWYIYWNITGATNGTKSRDVKSNGTLERYSRKKNIKKNRKMVWTHDLQET